MSTIPEALAIAVQHHQAGELHAAEQIYRQILAVDPNCADALHLIGLIASRVGKHEVAIEYIRRAIELKGNEAAFHCNLGGAFQALGKLDEAVGSFRRALELKPDHVEALNNLGNTLKSQGKLAESVECYRRALELQPVIAELHSNLGVALKDQGKLDDAVACFHRALELNPNDAESHNNLGNAFKEQWKLDEAINSFNRALALKSDFPEAYSNLGNALRAQGKLDEAIAFFHRALEQRPDYAVAHYNLGAAFQVQGKLEEAVARYSRALELAPDYAIAHFSRAVLMLQRGEFEQCWPEFEWRLKLPQIAERRFSKPRWDGKALGNRTILLHAEQGLGDTFQFVRYAAVVKKQNPGATVIVECQRPLAKLLASYPGMDQLIVQGDELPPFDVHISMLSLPGIFKTTVETIPAEIPYLFADLALIDHWRERLSTVSGLRIGINWQGRSGHGDFRNRDIPLGCFAVLAQIPRVRLIGLQKRTADERRSDAVDHPWLFDLGDNVDTVHGAFMDTAAIIKNLDLVVTSDTSIPNLAGALGVPVWLALPYVADWRWLQNRSDNPWYPTMRLFRQKSPGDWTTVFEEIQSALGQVLV